MRRRIGRMIRRKIKRMRWRKLFAPKSVAHVQAMNVPIFVITDTNCDYSPDRTQAC